MSNFAKRIRFYANNIGKQTPNMLRKIAAEIEEEVEDSPEMQEYKKLLAKMKSKKGIEKFKIFIDNPRIRKPIRVWLTMIDEGTGAGPMDFNDMILQMRKMIRIDVPAAKFMKMLLDYGIENGHIALNRILEKGRAKITLLKENQ